MPPRLHIDGDRATIALQQPQHGNRWQHTDLPVLHSHRLQVSATPGLGVLALAASGR